jgi:hypothetical protein
MVNRGNSRIVALLVRQKGRVIELIVLEKTISNRMIHSILSSATNVDYIAIELKCKPLQIMKGHLALYE